MTPADTVRKAVAEACGLPLEIVTDEMHLPEHNTAQDYRSCQMCLICESLDSWGVRLTAVSDLIRYVEAREAEGRG